MPTSKTPAVLPPFLSNMPLFLERGFTSRAMAATPTELWAEILLLVTLMERESMEPTLGKNVLPSRRKKLEPPRLRAPWKFLSVSKHINQVAIGHSVLWTKIQASLSADVPIPAEWVTTILNWSRRRPLSISITTQSVTLPSQALDSIFEEDGRIERFALSCRPHANLFAQVLPAHRLGAWHSLTSLELNFLPRGGGSVPLTLDLQFLPALQQYRECGSGNMRTTVLLPLHTLTGVALFLPSYHISANLGFARNLTMLEIIVADPNRTVDLATFGIVGVGEDERLLPNVRFARLKNSDGFLSVLSGKRLLSLALETASPMIRLRELERLLAEAQHSLQHFHFSSPHVWADASLYDMVWSLDRLQELSLEIKLPLDLVFSFVEDAISFDIWMYGVRDLTNGLEVSGSSPRKAVLCPALCSYDLKISTSGAQMERQQRLWLVKAMRRFVSSLCVPLTQVASSRAIMGGVAAFAPRLAWRVGDQDDSVDGDALLQIGREILAARTVKA